MENERKDIRELAIKHKRLQTLIHYVNKETLKQAHNEQMKGKASGVDKVTKEEYDLHLEKDIDSLLMRIKKLVGISIYEGKLVQWCMTKALNELFETKFLDCSYRFRPNRNCYMTINKKNQEWLVKFLKHDI